MLVLHGAWSGDDRLVLWGEEAATGAPPRRRGRATRAADPAHPFAAPVDRLVAALGVAAADAELEPGERTLHLPSTAARPASSPFRWDADDVEVPTEVRGWRVPTVAAFVGDALDLLVAHHTAPPRGVVLADALVHLARVARFGVDLCARGRVVPTLVDDGAWVARWEPTLADVDDDARWRALLDATPPSVCAAAPERTPGEAARRALDALVDACVAQAIQGMRLRRLRSRGGVEASWLAALTADDPTVEAPPEATRSLAARVGAWSAAARPHRGGWRTSFRVGAPDEGDRWTLDIVLQATDDPSLQVEAVEVWRARSSVLRAAGRAAVDPQEMLLADLGQAARLAPSVQAALASPRPTGVELDPAGAWRFLREEAPRLLGAGFGVIAPPWWSRPTARLAARLHASPQDATGGGEVGLDALCDVRWEVALGDDPLSPEELEALAKAKAGLVRVRGAWVELRPEDVEAALAFYRRKGTRTATVREVLRTGLGLGADPGLPVTGVDATGWLGDLLASASDARFAPVAAPDGFRATLRPYQERGLGWLLFLDRLGLGACLADDMGLGKTVQLLALLVHERVGGARPRPTLLVCPMSLVGNWQREAARFAPDLKVVVHHGSDRVDGEAFAAAAAEADLVVTTYTLVPRDRDTLGGVAWGRVVLDEAQNVKNAATRQARAVLELPSDRRVALTGTPVENRLSELWSILEFLNPGLLGTASDFRTAFALPIERYGDEDAAARLKRLTGPFVLRRLKTDRSLVADLPEKFEINVPCTLTREQASLYQAVVDEMVDRVQGLEEEARRGAVLAALTKLKQVCGHPALLLQDRSPLPDRSGKLARLEEILEEVLANGEKALVFTQFTELGHPLKEHLQARLGTEVLFLHGGTSRTARDAMVVRFADPRGPSVFLLSLKAGGTGLNLVAANHVVHFDRWWNPAVEDQATDRAFRIGQTRDVQVRKLVCGGTVEERIDAMIERKRALAGKVVSAGEGWLADLSTDTLRELVALDPSAVAEG